MVFGIGSRRQTAPTGAKLNAMPTPPSQKGELGQRIKEVGAINLYDANGSYPSPHSDGSFLCVFERDVAWSEVRPIATFGHNFLYPRPNTPVVIPGGLRRFTPVEPFRVC